MGISCRYAGWVSVRVSLGGCAGQRRADRIQIRYAGRPDGGQTRASGRAAFDLQTWVVIHIRRVLRAYRSCYGCWRIMVVAISTSVIERFYERPSARRTWPPGVRGTGRVGGGSEETHAHAGG
jgi:hypothetical protein